MSSYRILPASDPTPVSALPHDLQHGPVLQVSQFNSNLDRLDSVSHPASPLSPSHLLQWNSAQDNLRLNLKRDIYGMHAPMRLLMERKLVAPV